MTDIDGAVVDDTVRDMEAEPPSIEAPVGHPKLPGIVEALKGVFDPEIPVNIYELGLIYKIDIDVEETFTQRWSCRRRCRCLSRQRVDRRHRNLLLRLRQRSRFLLPNQCSQSPA